MRIMLVFSCVLAVCAASPAWAANKDHAVSARAPKSLQAAPVADSKAFDPDALKQPLMVIRFNQRTVYFEKPLYNAVARALEAKPEVMFNVVSLVPSRGEQGPSDAAKDRAEANLGKVVRYLESIGVPKSRFGVERQDGGPIGSDEVQIFVR